MSTFARAEFQEAAVEHIVSRLRDSQGSRRVLLADEVGLGKTVVARGVIEALLKGRRSPLTVVYLCSNAEIAEQNRRKLDQNSRRPLGRVTELALQRKGEDADLRLYSFTPGTSLKDGTGLAWERRLLLYLLYRIYGFPVWRNAWREFFRCGAGEESWYGSTSRGALRDEFDRKTSASLQRLLSAAWRCQTFDGQDLIRTAHDRVHAFNRKDADARAERNRLVARLRSVMQRVVLRHLEPDLVVLDEVQRFREVLDNASQREHIAAELFERRPPVLILSATPYRALTLGHEVSEQTPAHHEDFFKALEFLFDRDVATPARIRADLAAFGQRLKDPQHVERLDEGLLELKRRLEGNLTKVICRTERNWYVLDHRKGVDDTTAPESTLPGRDELEEFFRLQKSLAPIHGQGQVTEFWKSTPSLLTFLDAQYALFRKLRDDAIRIPRALLTPGSDVKSLAKRNHRISKVVRVAFGEDAPPRLWTAPTYTYYRDELFGGAPPRKALVFSGWRFVPKAVAVVTSRVATERMGGELEAPTQPLRFAEKRSFHAFDVCFPSPTLARIGDEAFRAVLQRSSTAAVNEVIKASTRSLRPLLREAGIEITPAGSDPIWRVVMRLESAFGRQAEIEAALEAWEEEQAEEVGSDAVADHRAYAHEWLLDRRTEVSVSESRLQRLALIAVCSPAVSVLRAIDSVFPGSDPEETAAAVAGLCLGPMRRYFNRPHVQQIVRNHRSQSRLAQLGPERSRGYTDRVLAYCADAHLQAVLDEYVYLLRHATQGETVEKAIEQLSAVWTLSHGKPRTNGARGQGGLVRIEPDAETHAAHFGLAFGEDVSRDEGPDAKDERLRKSVVREAFNSPFWPFVLATTSVGQEGLDFHLYCRDVLHWNLPSNPVDLEQREGRVNRRDCLAVRTSIARDWPMADRAERNPWMTVFERIAEDATGQNYKHGLFPHWVYECRHPEHTVRIQRHVPFFATSRDAAKYDRLKTGLALYRLVFGQVNQEDLLQDLQRQVEHLDSNDKSQVMRRLASYMLNLSPLSAEHARRRAEQEAERLLGATPVEPGLRKLLADVEKLIADHESLANSEELRGLMGVVEHAAISAYRPVKGLKKAVVALAYVRNPYDAIFDLHVEGGFFDDLAFVKRAWAAVSTVAI